MAKVKDITEKLMFNENPVIKIKEKELEVNADAETVLRIMGVISEGSSPKTMKEACELLFDGEAQKTLSEMKLQFDDYVTVVNAAIDLVVGADEEEGE